MLDEVTKGDDYVKKWALKRQFSTAYKWEMEYNSYLYHRDKSEYMEIKNRPNPNEAFPNPKIPSLCFIKNVVKNPRIIIGDYTYYDDVDGADQ